MSSRPTIGITPCEFSRVFRNEAVLEWTIRHDPVAREKLGQILGIAITNFSNQVYVSPQLNRQRADLVATTSQGELAVFELTVRPLDATHLYRGLGYGLQLNASHVVLIAPRVPKSLRQRAPHRLSWFNGINRELTVHFVQVHTYEDHRHGCYSLEDLPRPVGPNPQTTLLQRIATATKRAGDTTLAHVGIRDNRLEAVVNGHRIVLYAGQRNLSVYCYTNSNHNLRVTLEKLVPSLSALGLKQHKLEPTSITFYWATPTITPDTPNPPEIDQIAVAFTQIRRTVAAAYQHDHGGPPPTMIP
jgi:hypothetical protein